MRLLVLCLIFGAILPGYSAPEPSPFPPLDMVRSYFVYTPPPAYPQAAHYARHQGKGWFELKIDSTSGHVEQVTVLKSTGAKDLDDSVVATLRQWRAKPRVIHHAMIPVEFKHG